MTSKERVLKALNHEQTDRVPLDLGGMACCLLDGVYFKLKNYLGFKEDIPPFREGSNACYYDERILDYFQIDIRRLFVKTNKKYPVHYPDGSFQNEWGIVQRKGPFGMEFVKNPLEDAQAEELASYDWPRAEELIDLTGMKEQAQRLHEENRYAVALRAPMNGIFEMSCWLRGTENFMVDMLSDEDFAQELTDRVTNVQMEWYGYVLDEIGSYVDIVETGDDYGSQTSLLLSPECLERFILSKRKKLNKMIKEKAPQAKIFLHSCGAIKKAVPAIIDSGVDLLNPIQTVAADMDPYKLKQEFGRQICFHGGVDTQKAMRGTVRDVRDEVKKMLDAMYHDGGYILSSCNHIQDDIPVENIIAMFEAAKEFSV